MVALRHACTVTRLIVLLAILKDSWNEFTNSHTGDAMTPCDRLLTDARYEGTRGGRATGEALFAARLARHLVLSDRDGLPPLVLWASRSDYIAVDRLVHRLGVDRRG